jgi:hypothetical protein
MISISFNKHQLSALIIIQSLIISTQNRSKNLLPSIGWIINLVPDFCYKTSKLSHKWKSPINFVSIMKNHHYLNYLQFWKFKLIVLPFQWWFLHRWTVRVPIKRLNYSKCTQLVENRGDKMIHWLRDGNG